MLIEYCPMAVVDVNIKCLRNATINTLFFSYKLFLINVSLGNLVVYSKNLLNDINAIK